MSEESRKVERALREVTGGSNSDIRQLSKQLVDLGQVALKQQESRIVSKQVTPTGMVTTQVNQTMSSFDGAGGAKVQSKPAGAAIVVRICVNGVAENRTFLTA